MQNNDFSIYPPFAYGKYLITAESSQGCHYDGSIYLDWRDFRYPSGAYPNGDDDIYGNSEGGNDLWLECTLDNENATVTFRYGLAANSSSFEGNTIDNGETLTPWDAKNIPIDQLQLIANSNNNHPLLIWGPNPNLSTNPNQVKIYRATTDSLIPHPERLNYQLITTLGENINTWIDPDVIIGGDFNVNYYKIKLYDGSTLLNTSNIVNSWVQFYKLYNTNKNYNYLNDFKLIQNYPNPFNPSTKINYSIPENSFVEIKVFNIYGEEIKTLVNEYKTAGEYSVDFNGKNLASGVYLYSIKTNNYGAVKKMILQK